MSIARVARTLAVTAVAGVLAGTTYGAQAARAPAHQAQFHLTGHHRSVPPAHHGMRLGGTFPLGMHCESMDMST